MIDVFSLARLPLETLIHLIERSTIETKDIMYNFLSKVMYENVLLLKSSTHKNVVDVSPACLDENHGGWRVLLPFLVKFITHLNI